MYNVCLSSAVISDRDAIVGRYVEPADWIGSNRFETYLDAWRVAMRLNAGLIEDEVWRDASDPTYVVGEQDDNGDWRTAKDPRPAEFDDGADDIDF